MTLNDLKPPQRGFTVIFRNFWMQGTFQHWIATKWLEIGLDQDNQRMKFLATDYKRRFQQSKSQPRRFKEGGAGERQRRLPP